jgi:hypothetical protein
VPTAQTIPNQTRANELKKAADADCTFLTDESYERGCGVGRSLGVGVGLGVEVGVAVGVGVGAACAQYLPPLLATALPESIAPPQTIISLPVQTPV